MLTDTHLCCLAASPGLSCVPAWTASCPSAGQQKWLAAELKKNQTSHVKQNRTSHQSTNNFSISLNCGRVAGASGWRLGVMCYNLTIWECLAMTDAHKLGVLWAQWEGWDHKAKLWPLHAGVWWCLWNYLTDSAGAAAPKSCKTPTHYYQSRHGLQPCQISSNQSGQPRHHQLTSWSSSTNVPWRLSQLLQLFMPCSCGDLTLKCSRLPPCLDQFQ